MISFRELGSIVLLVSPRSEVISYTLFNIWATGHVENAVAASILLIVVMWSAIIIGRIIFKAGIRFQPTP